MIPALPLQRVEGAIPGARTTAAPCLAPLSRGRIVQSVCRMARRVAPALQTGNQNLTRMSLARAPLLPTFEPPVPLDMTIRLSV